MTRDDEPRAEVTPEPDSTVYQAVVHHQFVKVQSQDGVGFCLVPITSDVAVSMFVAQRIASLLTVHGFIDIGELTGE